MTILERLMQNKELLRAMLEMPTSANEQFAVQRREEKFNYLWEQTSMTRKEVIHGIKKREENAIEQYGREKVPDWLVRLEAQDQFEIELHRKFKDKGLI